MPKPILQAMVLAEHIYQDGASGKFIIAGTFASVSFARNPPPQAPPTPPAAPGTPGSPATPSEGQRTMPLSSVEQMGSPYLYLALAEVYGEIAVAIRFHNVEEAPFLFEINLTLGSKNPALIAEYKVPLPPLPIPKAGAYSLDLLYQNEVLGSWRVTAIDATPQPPT